MALETSAESPVPVRTVLQLVGGWIGRLGRVWVEGQIAECAVRGGAVFMTLRDPVAAVSVRVICTRQVFDAAEPAPAEGARVVIFARPDFNANRGSFALTALEIRAVGVGDLLARLERLRRQLGLGRSFFCRTKAAASFPAPCHRAHLRTRLGGPARRPGERRPALARRAVPGRADGGAGTVRGRGGDRRAAAAGRGRRRGRDRDRPRRRLPRGPAPVLRRDADQGGRRLPDSGGERDRARAGHAAARLRGRPARVHADRRGQAGGARRQRAAGAGGPAARAGPPLPDRLAGPGDGLAGRRSASRPALADPVREVERQAERVDALRSGPGRRWRPAWPGPATTWRTPGPGCSPCRPPRRCAAATRSCSTPTNGVVRARRGGRPGRDGVGSPPIRAAWSAARPRSTRARR